jgi:flagellar biogenesis protein FliO
MSPEATYLLESLGTVAIFGGALWVATRALRRMGAGRAKGPLEILARQPLDGRRSIYLVRVGKRVLVVGATDGSVTRLGSTSLGALDLPASSRPAPSEQPMHAEDAQDADQASAASSQRTRFRDVLVRGLGKKAPPSTEG